MPNLPNNGLFVFHFPAMWLVSFKKPWNLIGCFVLPSHSHWLRKRCDLEQKIVRFGNKWAPTDLGINRTAESQSDCKDNQWFQNGCNKKCNDVNFIWNNSYMNCGCRWKWTQLIDLASNVWLHSSVGRASHRYRGGHGFESRWSPDFFRLLLSNCLNWKVNCGDHSSLSS